MPTNIPVINERTYLLGSVAPAPKYKQITPKDQLAQSVRDILYYSGLEAPNSRAIATIIRTTKDLDPKKCPSHCYYVACGAMNRWKVSPQVAEEDRAKITKVFNNLQKRGEAHFFPKASKEERFQSFANAVNSNTREHEKLKNKEKCWGCESSKA